MDYEKYKCLLRAWFSKVDGFYHVVCWRGLYDKTEEEITFKTFSEFYRFTYADKNHHQRWDFYADLLESDCEGAKPEQLSHRKMRISAKTQKAFGIYNSEFESSIKPKESSLALTLVDEHGFLPATYEGSVAQLYPDLSETESVVFYISDLHLDWKVAHDFPNLINEDELRAYFKTIADRFNDEMEGQGNGFLIVVGDVSFNFRLVKLFFSVLVQTTHKYVYFVMGNHEYWDMSLWEGKQTVDNIVESIRKDLQYYGVTLLENDLAFPYKREWSAIKPVYTEVELSKMSDAEIRELFRYSGIGIFGGTGFSGVNNELNADAKVYGSSPIDRKEEIFRSKRTETMHERLKRIVPENRTMIVVTHMPITDWTNLGMKKGWFYLSGHTHENKRVEDDGYHFLSDNQMGYQGKNYHLKFFATVDCADIFEDRPDGQYEITKREYELFYETLWLGGGTNRDFEKILILKKESNYMFFGVTKEGLLYILDGGKIRSTCGHDLAYFYDRLVNYSASISAFLQDYTKAQRMVASEIKKLGGRGTIHGCIIDLDPPGTPFSYNHVYLNPFDGSLTPYFAETINDKYVYKNVPSLLSDRLPKLFERMSLETSDKAIALTVTATISQETELVINTEMYKVSRLLKSLQYTLNYKVIRIWNYALADAVSAENGRLLLKGLADPDSVSVPRAKPFRMHEDPNPEKPKAKRALSQDKPLTFSASQIKQHLLSAMREECKKKSGGRTKIVAMSSHHDMECRCTICGNVWNTTLHDKKFVCDKCGGSLENWVRLIKSGAK